ncbi:UDP-glucose 4-epimerase GalE [Arcobacter peruensis]|uniref:UDP-glucose 4-epimerase GalE n=1 Tax=Arcobacter peruensis TaxID=2320140 RepID=UPI000F07984E|nr:UDP-glucose 4-epimerase GalE [Arcobacter peruensis]
MQILITGAAGYIGSHVVKQLIEETNYEIIIIDNLCTGFEDTIKTLNSLDANHKRIKFYNQDLSIWNEVEEVFKENEIKEIIHFAASLVVPESVELPLKYYLNNTANTSNLVSLAVKYGIKKFIFSSTAATYGEPDKKFIPVNETCPTSPINPYGNSKLFSESVIKDTAFANEDFKFVILRYFNVAGADVREKIGQSTLNATHLIKVAAEAALGKREKMAIFGDDYDTEDGTCIRDYIHVQDLADAHLKALEYLELNPSDTFNCGYGYGYSVKEVIETMKKVSGVDFHVDIVPRRAGDPSTLISDNTKIKTKMNWVPKYNDLELICKTALEWEKKI